MKTDIHPEYTEATVRCTCGNEFVTRSTKGDMHVEICSNCHPFYTGKQKLVDTGGRVERFQRKLARSRGRQIALQRTLRAADHWYVSSPEQRDAPVGGQAVLEGVMMRGVSTWSVATRKDGEIAVESHPVVSWVTRSRVLRWPVIRGVIALAQSLSIGFKALEVSANAQAAEDEEPIGKGTWALTIVAALALAVGLFFAVPVLLTSLVKDWLGSAFLFWLVEGVVRTVIFLGYIAILSKQQDLRRLFQYHGAEHQVISTYEAGQQLTVENAKRFSRLHPRCGTSFLLVVMVVAIFVFAPIGLPEWYILLAVPDHRRAAGRGPVVRADQVRRAQPRSRLGPADHLARHAAAEADDARARRRPDRGRDRGAGGRARGRGPAGRLRRGARGGRSSGLDLGTR